MKRLSKVLALLLLCSSLYAADDFSFFGDSLSSSRSKGKEHTSLKGNAGMEIKPITPERYQQKIDEAAKKGTDGTAKGFIDAMK